MTDYIKREDALEQFDYYDLGEYLTTQIRGMLMDVPSADVAPIIRCKDCKYYDTPKNFKKPYCVRGAYVKVNADDYCSKGGKR